MKKFILILFLLSTSLFAVQKVVLQLDWLNQFQFAGYYVAQEMGYYKEVGIDVEIKEFNNQIDLSTVIEKGEADFAVGRSSLLIDKINGKDVVALGAILQKDPLMLIVNDDSNISSLSDLKNKRIMLTDDAKGTASIMAMLSSSGITQKDIEIIPHSFNLDDLIKGKVDAVASYISNEPIVMEEKGIGYKIFHPKDYGFQFYSDILFTSSDFIKKNPKLTKDFYEASIKGWEYAFENISNTAEIIYKHYNTQDKTLIQFIKEGEILKRLAYSKKGTIGYLDIDRLNDIMKVYKVLGLASSDVDLGSFIYEYNHPKELIFKLSYDEIFHIAFWVIIFLIILTFGMLFISFQKHWLHTQGDLKKEIANQKEEIEKQNKLILLQSRMAAIGEMLSNIAHQWRQPLNIISLNTVKIETSILLGNKMTNEDLFEITGEINRQSQYLSQTIEDFKNYFNSNVDGLTPFNLGDAIQKLNKLTKDTFNNSHIDIVVRVDDCTLAQNESLFIQALLNIYNNAIQAIIEKEVPYRYFFVDAKCDANGAIITLKDSGGGINEESILKIFEPYYTTKHKSKGTGLGMYITYGIITGQFNGTISVNNAEYEYMGHTLKGAEFIITIPIVKKS
ncbi:MAG: ABC transporter substrate-binding protein [Campylobacterales bacterium]|nr:ABC transporter substrate-binding protein [Campylobacterales bacterium]